MKDIFSLLLDDRHILGFDKDCINFLKAHLVFCCLTNSSITIADSFCINNHNLRYLIENDDVISKIVEYKMIKVALRNVEDDQTLNSLDRVEQTFRINNKLRKEVEGLSAISLNKLDKYAPKVRWNFSDIADNYFRLCQKTLYSDSCEAKFGQNFTILKSLLKEHCGESINRDFIYYKIIEEAKKYRVSITAEQHEFLKLCVDAPYLQNLPTLLKLDPIYDQAQKPSFDLMRQSNRKFENDISKQIPNIIDIEHYIHGLCNLPFDAIVEIRSSNEFNNFIVTYDDFSCEDFEDALIDLDICIQNTILKSIPELKHLSKAENPRTLQRRFSIVSAAGGDMLSLLVSSFMDVSLPFSILAEFIFPLVPRKIERKIDPVFQQKKQDRRIQQHFINQEKEQIIQHRHSLFDDKLLDENFEVCVNNR